jgi:phage terminase large subunit-like protein
MSTTTKTLSDAVGSVAFERMRDDCVLFIKAFESRVPWPYQERMLRQALERKPDGKYQYRRVVISLPRQNAKSTLSAWIALHRLYCASDRQEIVSVANDTAQAGIILGDARRVISGSDVLYNQLDNFGLTRGEIRLTNGSRWLIKGGESVASRG